MRTYDPTTNFVTPPVKQGQAVEYSYAMDAESEVIIERRYDGSDGSTSYTAYAYSDDESEFEPQNEVPSLGKNLGHCLVA